MKTVCTFFGTKRGCRNGRDCLFQHVLPAPLAPFTATSHNYSAAPHKETTAYTQSPKTATIRAHRRQPGVAESKEKTKRQSTKSSHHLKQSNCYTSPKRVQETKTRHLGGALVTFGEGASVDSIEPRESKKPRLQLHHIICCWVKSQKIAVIEFKDAKATEMARRKLRTAEIMDRKVKYRVSINRSRKLHHNRIIITDLNPSVSIKALKDACGIEVHCRAWFDDPPYSASDCQILRIILQLAQDNSESAVKCDGTIQTISKDGKIVCKSMLEVNSTDDVANIRAILYGERVLGPYGPTMSLSHSYKSKMTNSSAIAGFFADQIRAIATFPQLLDGVGIRLYTANGSF